MFLPIKTDLRESFSFCPPEKSALSTFEGQPQAYGMLNVCDIFYSWHRWQVAYRLKSFSAPYEASELLQISFSYSLHPNWMLEGRVTEFVAMATVFNLGVQNFVSLYMTHIGIVLSNLIVKLLFNRDSRVTFVRVTGNFTPIFFNSRSRDGHSRQSDSQKS